MGLTRYYIILLIRGTLIYRVADELVTVFDLLPYDEHQPGIIPLGYCDSVDWLMEWRVAADEELRAKHSGKVLSLLNYIRQTHHA